MEAEGETLPSTVPSACPQREACPCPDENLDGLIAVLMAVQYSTPLISLSHGIQFSFRNFNTNANILVNTSSFIDLNLKHPTVPLTT